MNKWLKKGWALSSSRCSERLLCMLLICGIAITLVPVLWIGIYDVPCADDYSYGTYTHHIFQQTGSLLEGLKAAVHTTADVYYNWQGTFSAIFLMSLQPEIYGEGMYRFVPFILVGSLAVGEFFFSWALFRKTFGATRSQFLMVAGVWLMLSVHLVPSAVEAFYWYNGAIFYTGFHSWALVYFGMMLWCLREKQGFRRNICIGLMCVLSVVLGGGNYVTALLSTIVMGGTVVFLAVEKKGRWKRFIFPFLLLCVAFAMSIIAPGNQIRQAELESMDAVSAIQKALITGAVSIGDNLDVMHLLIFGGIGMILWRIAGNTAFRFPLPLLVGAISYGLYAAQFCPTLYAMNSIGPGRVQDIIYNMFLLLSIFNLFYVLGWIRSHYDIVPCEQTTSKMGYHTGLLVALGIAIVLCAASVPRETPMTGTRALQSLRSGAAQQYYAEYQARVKLLTDETKDTVELSAFTQRPYVLFFADGTEDARHWRNCAIANYYGKKAVIVR